MEIKFKLLQKHFESLANLNLSDLNEYQNKYYVAKKTCEIFSGLSEKIVYDAIEQTSSKLKEHFLSPKYIIELCANIFDRTSRNI